MKNRTFAVLALFILFVFAVSCKWFQSVATNNAANKHLFPFSSGVRGETKWGYMNGEGKVVIQPQFVAADFFFEGRGRVKAAGKNGVCWGYIDETGKMVIEPQFQESDPRVWIEDNHENFSEGLAIATIYNSRGKQVVIDKNGQIVFSVPEGYSIYNKFSEGLVRVSTKGDRMNWGYMDKIGKIVIEPQFFIAHDFHEGLAAVKMDKYGFIDKTGQMVIKEQFDYVEDFSEGLAAVQVNGKYGFIDRRGEMVIEPQFSKAGRFSEGLAWVETGDSIDRKIFYIDKSGKTVIDLPKPTGYSEATNFSEGLAWFGNNVIDKTGKTVFTSLSDSRLSQRRRFKNGVSIMTDEKSLIYYVDKTGKEIKPKFN